MRDNLKDLDCAREAFFPGLARKTWMGIMGREGYRLSRRTGEATQGGVVADKTTLILLGALRSALAEPAGLPLFAAKAAPGLFPSTQPGKQSAQRALDEGLLQPADSRLHTLTDK